MCGGGQTVTVLKILFYSVCQFLSPCNKLRGDVDKASFLTFSENSHLQLLYLYSYI